MLSNIEYWERVKNISVALCILRLPLLKYRRPYWGYPLHDKFSMWTWSCNDFCSLESTLVAVTTRFTQSPVSQPPFFSSFPLPSSSVSSHSASLFHIATSLLTAVDCSYSLPIWLCFALPASHHYTRIFYKPSGRDVLDLLRRCTRYVGKIVLFRFVISVYKLV